MIHVDDEWFQNAETIEMFGRSVHLCAAEEMIWSKAFIMERERLDEQIWHTSSWRTARR